MANSKIESKTEKRVTFRIYSVGNSGILMNNPEKCITGTTGTTTKKQYVPEDEAEKVAYRTDKGQLYLRSDMFRASIIGKGGGAKGRKIGKFSAASRAAAAIRIIPENMNCVLYDQKKRTPITTYEIYSKPVVRNKARVMSWRPNIKDWYCDVTYIIDTEIMSVEMVLELLNISGRVSGVADFRFSTFGWFGGYRAEILKS
ncbi:hypothetical protein ES703_61646 [subsurface metagenome]